MGLLALTACTQECPAPDSDSDGRMEMRLRAEHPGGTRVTATAFEAGDRIGLYVVDDSTAFNPIGNLVNNELLTCNGADQSWTPRMPIYWSAGRYSLYAYYPYQSPVKSVTDMPFSVSTDQSTARVGDTPGGYEASDLLCATRKGVQATASPVALTFHHAMSHLTIRLIKGEDYEGDLPTNAQVHVLSTVPQATIDLATGSATRDIYGQKAAIRARQRSRYVYEAIVVPQRIQNRMPLVEVEMEGVSYMYESTFQFKAGTDHLVSLVITDNPERVTMNITGEIENW